MGNVPHIWFLVGYFVAVLALVVGMVGVSFVLGQRHLARATILPFECGMLPIADARIRFPVQFYMIAMMFVIFDLESVFIYAWAIVIRQAGWSGYLAILGFIGVLLAALAYLWRIGALEWGPTPRVLPLPRVR